MLVKFTDGLLVAPPSSDSYDREAMGNRLRLARETAGIHQVTWGGMVGKTTAAVSHWEMGRSYPPLDALIKYAELLGADLHWLLTGRKFRPDNSVVQTVVKILAQS